jgi:hypothetical protein
MFLFRKQLTIFSVKDIFFLCLKSDKERKIVPSQMTFGRIDDTG